MKSVFVIDDNGQGLEEVRSFLRKRGYGVAEYAEEYSEELLFTRFVVDRFPVQAFWSDSNGRFFYVNDAACQSLGYTRDELVTMSVSDVAVEITPDAYPVHWRELQERKTFTFETVNRRKDGSIYPVEVNINHVVFDGRECNCALVTDISERKRVEEKLLLQQYCIEKADTIFMQFSPGGKILMANECATRSLGYTIDELLELSDADITPIPSKEKKLEYLKIFDAGGSVTGDTLLRRKDGSTFPVEFTANKLDFHNKTFFIGFFRDITERRKAEEALQLNRYIVDNASIGIYRGQEDGRILYANEHSARMLGYTREELCSMTFFDIVPAITEESWKEYRRQLRAKEVKKFEAVHRRKDGTVLPVEVTVNYLEFGGNQFSCSFAQDITERKNAEEALRESEKKFRLLIETSPNAIVVIRGERIVYANPAATQASGFTAEQLRNMDFCNTVHEDFREVARERLMARLRGEPVSERYEYRIVDCKGGDRWVIASSVSIDYEGEPAILVSFADITEAKRSEEALRESEVRLKLAMDMAKLVQWEFDTATSMFRFDDQFYNLYGTSTEQEGGTLMSAGTYIRKFVHPDDIDRVEAVIEQSLTSREGAAAGGMEHRIIRTEGEERYIAVRWDIICDQDGRVVRLRGVNQDITEQKCAEEERKNLEVQLHQAQKMEAVGQLAGGMAHDFNNILTAIMGFAEVAAMRMEHTNPLQHHVSQVLAAAERAADLTRSLLAFSRKQVLHVRSIDVCEVVDGVKKMLRRLIPEDINFRVKTVVSGMTVMADRGQVEQVLMNLVTNARDAMPKGGDLTIETGSFLIDEAFVKHHGFGLPGRYAVITVKDTGCGMDRETRERIFDPFFTTKQVGKGTGLGLSITYGIVKQHNGFITVDSLPGKGTVFCVYLPISDLEKEDLPETRRFASTQGGTETILLAEDDDAVRDLHRTILEEHGYAVIEATDGREALEKFMGQQSCVDLLMTDVIMPNIDGKSLYEEIRGIRPDVRVLFVSGYSTDVLNGRGLADGDVDFLSKPVLPSELLKRLRQILDCK